MHTAPDNSWGLTVTIAGVSNGASACSDTTNSGFASSATEVNLGAVATNTNISAQTITVSTNAANGYVMTATSSGFLINPASGYYIPNAQGNVTNNNAPAPVAITAGTPAYGIHPCGNHSTTLGTPPWGTGGGASNRYANPSQAFYYTLAISNGPASSVATTVEYAATVNATFPPGLYANVLTYVVTPIF